ncbi:N-acetylneuraminate synthase family protein [Flavivirga aquimarina]|uniref:N-acetylneuraminate synthase family protein n=1 Tax=Flavivirga aquimarina TaxID=2027862 RepID=A0ABT8WBP7_9FLAO|nr:N-acetylneuraminate synthase family protein [Flavivirga aquimarina]MDO5970559.1 N-acetylneuraminate synthase family protein [Flavivirga aquimarina]
MSVKIIAEIGQAHNGSLGMAHAYIDALSKTGVNAVKFQTHIAEAESSIYEPFRVQFSKQDTTRYEYWKRMEFTNEQWKGLKEHCDEKGVEFISSPFSNAAVDLLEKLDVKCFKVGSGEVTNFLLLERLAQTSKPLIISSGMSSLEELDKTVDFLKSRQVEFSILQCTTSYPTKPEQYGLNMIAELKGRYDVPIGFSDHSSKLETSIAAVTLGAEIIEFHAVFNKEMFGPDVSSSLTIEEIRTLTNAIRNIEIATANPVNKNDNTSFKELKAIFEKSLAVNKDLSTGHVLTFSDLEAKKPANKGISATNFKDVIGKTITRGMKQWEFLTKQDLNE